MCGEFLSAGLVLQRSHHDAVSQHPPAIRLVSPHLTLAVKQLDTKLLGDFAIDNPRVSINTIMSQRFALATLISVLAVSSLEAFAPTLSHTSTIDRTSQLNTVYHEERRATALFAGFGASGGKKKKEIKLKPKQQWDRFLDMKTEAKIRVTKIRVAVRHLPIRELPHEFWFLDMKTEAKIRVAVRVSEDDEWLAVGSVRSKDDKLTEVAVFRQRALIAEVRRVSQS